MIPTAYRPLFNFKFHDVFRFACLHTPRYAEWTGTLMNQAIGNLTHEGFSFLRCSCCSPEPDQIEVFADSHLGCIGILHRQYIHWPNWNVGLLFTHLMELDYVR